MIKIKKNNLALVGFLAAFILAFFFLVCPLFKDIKTNSEELVSQKGEFINLEYKIANLEKFKVLYKNLEEILRRIDNLFISSDVPVDFIGFLETNSDKYYLKTDISPSSVSKTGEDLWPSFTFQLSSAGSFSNFLKFLERLENSPYLIEIKNLNIIKASGEKTAANDVRVLFSIKVFAK